MINKICIICKKQFIVHNYRKNTAKLCSFKCRFKWQTGRFIGSVNPNWKGTKICKCGSKKHHKAKQC